MQRKTYGCPYCGSEDVLRDAFVCWSVETQEWVVHDFYDDMICNECGRNFNSDDLLEKETT